MGFFVHWVPAYAVDTGMRLLGKEPFLVKVVGKVQAGIESLEYFTTREWIWANDNTVRAANCGSYNYLNKPRNIPRWHSRRN